jgi:hypothetical protein
MIRPVFVVVSSTTRYVTVPSRQDQSGSSRCVAIAAHCSVGVGVAAAAGAATAPNITAALEHAANSLLIAFMQSPCSNSAERLSRVAPKRLAG